MTQTPGPNAAVCTDCGHSNGGKPVPHPVGWWLGECSICGEERSCCAVRDWVWPNGRPADARGITARQAEEIQE